MKSLNIFELAFARTYSFDVVNPSTAVISFGSATYFAKILSLFWTLITLGIAYPCLLGL